MSKKKVEKRDIHRRAEIMQNTLPIQFRRSHQRNSKTKKILFEVTPDTFLKHSLLRKYYILSDLLPILYERELKRLAFHGHITELELLEAGIKL